MRILLLTVILTQFFARIAIASPIFSLEVKPLPSINTAYKGSKDNALALEVHVSEKIALFAEYFSSNYSEEQVAIYAEDRALVQNYYINEPGFGVYLYSSPESSSLFIGAGLIKRRSGYHLYHNGLPMTYESQSQIPTAYVGYRWTPAKHLLLRAGLKAKWIQSQVIETEGDSQSYFLTPQSHDVMMKEMQSIEGQKKLNFQIDLGIGVIF